MSIRLLAKELYDIIRMVEILEMELEKAPYDKKDAIREKLRGLKAEKNRLRQILDGKKG